MKRFDKILIPATVIAVIILCTLLFSFMDASFFGIFSVVNLAVIIIIFAFMLRVTHSKLSEKKKGIPLSDERTVHIEGRVFRWSYMISLYFILAELWYIMIAEMVMDVPALPNSAYLIIALLVMSFSNMCLRWSFGRK